MVTIAISYGPYLTAGDAPFFIEFTLVDEYGRLIYGDDDNSITYSTTTDSSGNGSISVAPNNSSKLSWYFIKVISYAAKTIASFTASVPDVSIPLTWEQLCSNTYPASATSTSKKESIVIKASEAISAGAFVNIYNNNGVANLRNAIAQAGYEAHGFVVTNVSAGAYVAVCFSGINCFVSGVLPGEVYLSTVAGGATNTAPDFVQLLGVAIDSSTIEFTPGLREAAIDLSGYITSDQLATITTRVAQFPMISATAGQDLGGQRVVMINNGQAFYCDASDTEHIGYSIGITATSASNGSSVLVQILGEIREPSWSFSPGMVWLGTNGALTQTPPSSGVLQSVGRAIDPATLQIDFSTQLLLG